MNIRLRKGCFIGAVVFIAAPALAFDIATGTDLSATASAFSHAQSNSLPAQFQGPEYQLTGQLSAYWNVQVYPLDSIEFDLRYGLGAQSILDGDGSTENAMHLSADYRAGDIAQSIDWTYSQDLDRLNVSWYSPFGDYTLGRQPISFGQAKIFSPVDVIQPADIVSTDRSYRPGVDAMRGTWSLGAVSEVDAGYVFGNDTVAFARLKAYLLGSDWELIGLQINEDHRIVSLGTNTGFGNVGLWQESALLSADGDQNVRITLGADYTFFDDLYVMTEVHYNGLGNDDYLSVMNNSFYQLGAVTPWGQWYGSVQASYPLNVLTQWQFGATANLDDGSVLMNSIFSYNASDALTVNAVGIVPLVKEHSLNYEYGPYPLSLSVELNWYL